MRESVFRKRVSNMADSLTDEQLIEELESYGENITLPIKANRRPILIKKLNHLRTRNRPSPQKGKGRQTPPRRTLLDALSSDDSDAEPADAVQASQNRSRSSLDPGTSSKITEVVKRSLRRRPTGSPAGGAVRNRLGAESPAPPADSTDLGETPEPRTSMRSAFTGRRRREPTPEPEDATPATEQRSRLYPDLSSIASPSGLSDSFSGRKQPDSFESSDSDFEGSSYEVENKSVNTSFGLMRGAVRRTPASNHVTPNRDYSPYSTRSTPGSNHLAHRGSPAWRGRQKRRFYPEHISLGLVGLALAFFVIVGFSYVFLRKGVIIGWIFSDSPVSAQDSNLLLCPDGTTEPKEGCYFEGEVKKAVGIIHDLYKNLSVKKGQVVCEEADEATQRLLVKQFRKELPVVEEERDRLYNCCIDLILANRHWNIIALDKLGIDAARKKEDVVSLESAVASLSFFCRLKRSFTRVLWSIFVLVAGVAGLGLLFVLLWWRIQAKEREEQKVFAMVEQIIDLLKEQHELASKDGTLDQATGLAVQHVRDQLLPPATRKANQHIWDKAVKFIEANESRVRLETQVIEGEEFAVWRWIQAVPNGGKVWQGQAFGEHNENNSTTSVYSPTPCLKIRNMFDKEVENEEDWEENVKDALLEKCRDIKSLVHIFVDKTSREGCVYVKCSSKEAAGQVRQALHGWWFDGRLVTVKHLKVEHYHNRWSESKFAWRPLQPSTNQMRSLAQPYYRSSLEMT